MCLVNYLSSTGSLLFSDRTLVFAREDRRPSNDTIILGGYRIGFAGEKRTSIDLKKCDSFISSKNYTDLNGK